MLRLGCCCYICKRWFFVDSQEGLLSSRGGGAQTYWHQAYKGEMVSMTFSSLTIGKYQVGHSM